MAEQAKWQHNRQKLFDGLKEEGFSGFGNTVEEFGEKLNKENNRATIYNTLKSYGYKGIGDSLDDFTAKVMPPTEVQHVSPQVLAEGLAENQRIVSDFNRQSAARGRELSADVKAQNPRNRFTDGSRESMHYNPNSNKLEATYTLPTGERTFSKTDATLKRLEYNGDMGLTATGQLRQAQKRLAEYEDKLDARAEVLMREHERTKESLPGFVNVLSDIGNAVRADKMGGNTGNTPTYDYAEFVTDPEYNALLSSIRDTEKQIRQLENWVEKEKHGERFWHDFGRGVLQEFVLNPDVWDFGRAGFRQGSTLANISNKLNNNEELTESEKNTLNDLYLLQNVQSEFGDLGTGARWGSIAGQSLSFMKDFALSGPISGGVVKGITRGLRQLSSNAVKSMGIKAAEKASAQILKEGLPTYLATNLATRAATKAGVDATSSLGVEVAEKGLFNYLRSGGSTAAKKLIAEQGVMNTASIITLKALGTTAEDLLIRAPLMATTIQGFTTGANIIDTKLGPVVFNKETGELQFADDKTWSEAAWQSGMDAVVENMSEMAGAHAPTIVDMARVFGARRLAAGILRTTREGAGTVLSNVNKFLKQAGVNGYLSEVGEEYYGQGWRTLLNLESAYTDVDGERKNLISDSEWHADLWGGIGLTIGLTGAASVSVAYPARGAYNMSVYLKHKHNVRKADKKASKVFSPEQWEPIKEYIDASDNGNVSAIVGQAFKDNYLTAEQKEAITNYTWNLLIFRGYNLGEMLLSRNGLNSANNNATEAQNSYLDGYTADAGERNAISIALDLQRNKLLELTTPEVVAEVEADPIGALSKLGDDPDVNQAVIDFVNAKQTDNGMSQRLIDNLDDAIEENNATVDSCVNRSTGMVEEAILNSNGDNNKNNIYVVSGNLVANEDNTIDTDKSDNSIIVRDAETGIVSMISPNDILSIFPPVDPNEVKLRTEEALRKLYAQRTANNVSGTVYFNQGDTYTLTDAEGNETQIQVFPNTDGIIDNGDGTVNVSTDGGNTIVTMNKEEIQSMVDLTNRNRVAQQIAETDAKRVEESITQWRDRFGDDLQAGTSFNILYDGKPVTITITEIFDNGIIYYTDNNGEDWQEGIASLFKERSDYEDYANGDLIPSISYHIGDTIEAWGDNGRRTTGRLVAESPDGGFEVEFDSPVRGSMVAVLPAEEIQAMDLNATSSPVAAEAEANVETSEPPSTAEPSALSRIPRGDDGELMYEAADADTAWDAIVEEAGDEAMAKRVVDSMVADKEAALKKAEKSKPRAGTTPSEKIAAERERMAAIGNARSVLDHWKRIALVPLNRKADENARLRREAEEAAKARREAEAAERRQREEAARIEREMLGGVPDMVDDKASDARARGYRRVNGHVVERQAEVPRLLGKESRVKFSDRDIPAGNWAIIDASQLQPSHIDGRRNPLHFLDEAQPKERKEADSVAAARRMAGNIRAEEITGGATAYSGSPTVNTRGEVIQGNNRSAALREMWQSHPQEAARYKQYLAEHADGFGFSPEAIENMGQPVLVNMLDVSDSKAIELGQFVASDTETGGIERIRPKNTVQKLGGDMGIFASKLLQGGDEEASFSQLLDTNGQEALRWMNAKGIITDTQYRSAFAPNGSLTGEAKNDLRGIMLQGIFQDSITQLETMFEALPAKAQKAILATMYRDFDSPESDRILPEVQMSIQAYYALSHFEAFANAKNYKEARIAAETWRMQYAFDDATGESYLPSERFSNFALLLASAYKAQTQRLLQGVFNRIFDFVQGRQEETLFEKPDNTPLPLAEAIDETIKEFNLANNFRYDGQIRSDVLGDNSPRSREGRRGSGGNAPAGGRSENGVQSTDSAGGAGGNFENEKESLNLQNGQNPQENEVPERISQRKRGTQNARDARMAEVADEIARGSRLYEKEHGGSRTILPGLFAQQRAAEQIAKENGYWIPMQEIASLGLPGPSGNENDTYVSGNTIYKVNNLLNSGSILKLFERIQTYNSLFPESNYEFIGFTGFDGRNVFPVFSQELVKNAVFASTSEIDDYMDTLGFRKTGEGRYENDVYEVWDVLPKNVLKSASGNIYVVDAEIRLAKSTEQNQTLGEKVSQAEAETDINPTDGQKEAGNYKKGHVRVGVFDITIENPKGSVRSGVDANGKPWQTTMNNTYGYMRGTEGVDGDHIDVFLSDNLDGWNGQNIYVVDQYNEDGTFDEHKVMLGFNDEAEAQDAYFSNYEKGWGEKRKIVLASVAIGEFEKWIGSSRRKTKPFAEYKGVNKEASQPIGQADTSDTAASDTENGAVPRQDSLFADTGDNAQAKQKDAAEKLHERYEQAYAEALKKARREKGKDVDEDAVRNLVDFNYEGDLYMDAERILNELMGGKGETLSDDMFEWEMEAGNGNEDGIPSLPQIIDEIARRESGNSMLFQKTGEIVVPTAEEAALRDAIVERLRQSGLEVITDVDAGQRMIDLASGQGEQVRTQAALDGLKKASGFILSALKGTTRQRQARIEIPTRANRLAEEAIGHPIKSHIVNVNALVHIKNRHGENGTANDAASIPLKDSDIALMPYVMAAPTRVLKGSIAANGTESVRYEKELENGIVVVVEREGRFDTESMENITMWANKKSATNVTVGSKPSHSTSETIVISEADAAKIRKDAEDAIKADVKLREHRVFHGSGADFDRFDHSHMSEGEGAQAYGWGTYVTEVEGIGKGYATQKRGRISYKGHSIGEILRLYNEGVRPYNVVLSVVEKMELGYSFEEAKADLEYEWRNSLEYDEQIGNKLYAEGWKKNLSELAMLHGNDFQVNNSRHLYTVEIPDDNGSNYLEYGNPLPETLDKEAMAEAVFRRILETDEDGSYNDDTAREMLRRDLSDSFGEAEDGETLYGTIAAYLGNKGASVFLHGLGFVGISYPAEYRSGGRKDKAKNYVIFNEDDLQIVDKARFFRTPRGEAYGFTIGGRIYIDPRIASAETPIHEYSHLWAEALRHGNAGEWRNIVGLMKGTPAWEETKSRYPELATDDEIADEVLATYSGRRGAERLREQQRKIAGGRGAVVGKAETIAALEQVKEALRRFWKAVADFLHIRFSTAEEVADRVVSDLLEGVNPARGIEEQSIIDRAKAGGTYMKAPNGKPTNLTERQWVQVRTRAFKRWFGDWEKAARIEKLRKSEPVVVSGNDYQGKYELNSKSAENYIVNSLRGEYANNDTGDIINVTRASRKVAHHDAENDIHLKSIAYIPQMIENAIFIDEVPNEKGTKFDSYRYYVVGLTIDGADYTAKLVVGRKNGGSYYDHALTEIEKNSLLNLTDGVKADVSDKETVVSGIKDKRLVSILQTNSSKVVDENGEPRVVYHGTTKGGFSEFNSPSKSKVAQKTEAPENSFWFVSERDKARSYSGKDADVRFESDRDWQNAIYPVFLNMKNPLVETFEGEYWDYRPQGGTTNDVAAEAREKGHDGAIIQDVVDEGEFSTWEDGSRNDTIPMYAEGAADYVVFSPSQIKSATDNTGVFSADNDDIRFSLRNPDDLYREQPDKLAEVNERFNEQLQRQIDGTLPKGHVYELGYPSDVLLSAGLPYLPIEMAASRLSDKSMQENHPFDLSEVRNLPNAIQNPMAVFRSATHIGSFVVMTEIEHAGKNFVAAIEANKRKGKIEVNSVRSVYPKTNRQVANWINEELLEYADKKRMAEWLSKQRSNSADVRKQFNHAANIVRNFENPSIGEDDLYRGFRRYGGNSGYVGYSMSVRAAQAREDGRYPKTDFRKEYNLTPAAFDMLLHYGYIDGSEWHHTSMYGNRTTFYDWQDDDIPGIYAIRKKEVDALARQWKKAASIEVDYNGDRYKNARFAEEAKKRGLRYVYLSDNSLLTDEEFREERRRQAEVSASGEDRETRIRMHQAISSEYNALSRRRYSEIEAELESDPAYREEMDKILARNEQKPRELARIKEALAEMLEGGNAELERVGDGAFSDDELSYTNDPRAKVTGRSSRTARQRREFAERERRRMAERVSALAEKLHLGNVEIVTDLSQLQGKRKEAKGFYSRSTGKITVVLPNHASAFDAEQTLLHEAVGHYGLRRLFGEHFDTFLDNVFQNAEEDVRRRIVGLSEKRGWDFRTATEEYLASLAEDTDFENVNASWWQKIKSFFLEMLRKIGFEGFTGVTLSDNELRYLLWRSYENLAEPGRYRGILEEAADIVKQDELKVGNYAPREMNAQRVAENVDLLYRNGEDVALGLADRYQKRVTSKAGEAAEAYQDNMRSVKILQEEIAKETGRPIADFENAYDRENHENSINKIEQEQYIRDVMKPTEKVLAKIQLRKWENGEFITFDEIEKYLIAKHGLERNPKFARRDADAIYTEAKEELDKNLKDGKIAKERYNEKLSEAKEKREKNFAKFRERDYSGLTALFSGGNPNMPVEQLEEAAQKYVDDFESAVAYRDKEKEDRVNSIAKGYTNLADELWELIRKSKEFTLNKQYKTGLISAELRDRLMNMFDYYVPLRGFADETAGDLYKYQPTDRASKSKNTKLKQQKAEGRTSQAGNILATMMQMAGLSITAGNRNYTNQALLNLALNHPTNLLTVSGLYYMQEKGTGKWIPVYPEISEDMSAEERQKAVSDFESRCKEVIAKEKALPLKDKTIVRMEKGLLLPIRMDAWQKQQHSVRVQRGGEEYVVFVNGDPRAAEALNGLLDKRALEWAARFTRWVSANVTSRNPEFLVSNAARDFQSAVTTILVDSGYEEGYLNKFLTNYHNNFSPIAFRGARKGHYNGIYALYRKYEKGELDMNNERERYFKEFLENGGETGYTQLWQIDKLDKELKNMTKLQKGGFDEAVAFTKQALTATNNVIEFANRGIENATRFAAYMTSRQMGKSVLSSINDAKDISVNFNRHGSGALGYAYFKSLFMFLNPAIQGLAKEIRLFRGDPAKASLFFIGIPIALGALVPFAMMLLADGGDPEDYFGLTAHTRQNNLVLGFNGNYIKIPLPPELRAFYGVGEAIASHTLNDKQHGNMGLEIANSLSQLFPRDIVDARGLIDSEHSLLTGVIKGFTPDMMKVPLEAYVWNENFAGYPITSQYDWNASYPEYLRSDKNTPKWMIETSKFVNESTGGTARRKGWADSEYLNPSAIEHITTSYLGGMFTFSMKMGKTIAMIWDEEMRDSRNVPVVSRLYQHVDAGAALKRYYNEMSILYANECEADKAEFNYYYNQESKGIFDKAFIVSEEMQQNKFKRWIIAEPHIKRINELRREYNKQRDEGDTSNLEKTETELQQAKKEFVDKMDAFDSTMEIDPFAYNKDVRLYKIDLEYKSMNQKLNELKEDSSTSDIMDRAAQFDALYKTDDYRRYMIAKQYKRVISNVQREIEKSKDADQRAALEKEVSRLQDEMIKEIDKPQN